MPDLSWRITPEERERQRKERVRRWIASLTERDWARIQAEAEALSVNNHPAAIADLDAPIRVQSVWPGEERWSNGERFGVLKRKDGSEVVLLGWEKSA